MADITHVGIIGGGIAGLAAAAKLAEKGIKSTILEAGSQLGGRARNVSVEFNSQVVLLDNGQHILLGAYQETLALLRLIGVDEKQALMRLPLTLETISIGTLPSFKLSTPNYLPFPLNQLVGFLCCKGLLLSERWRVLTFVLGLKQTGFHLAVDEPLADYLNRKKQSTKTVALLWEPLCLAALNTPIHKASSKVFLNVLKDTFNAKKHDSDLLLPKQGLSQLFAQPITRYINKHSSEVLTNHRVTDISSIEDGFNVKSKGKSFEFSHVIIATSNLRLKNVASGIPNLAGPIEITNQYQHQPIYTIYLQYATDTKLPRPMLGLSGGMSQWAFDRGSLCGQHGLIAVIISAEGKHQKMSHDALALAVANELHRAFPAIRKPKWHQVIAEKRATFSCDVNLPRPANSTRQTNLFIAGDYTYGDYPATIEGAVRSGFKAANMVI